MNIPQESTPYILLQRTQYMGPWRNRLFTAIDRVVPFAYYNRAVARFARQREGSVHSQYAVDMEQEYRTIAASLPETCASILDIGCGMAGIDLFLHRHYDALNQSPRLCLLDKTAVESKVYYGFKGSGAFYNSLDLARQLLIQNGVPAGRVTTIEVPDSGSVDLPKPCDLVLSLISWGFHYPVEVYRDAVADALSESGVLILDVRTGTDGRESLAERFGRIESIVQTEKYDRLVCRDPKPRTEESHA